MSLELSVCSESKRSPILLTDVLSQLPPELNQVQGGILPEGGDVAQIVDDWVQLRAPGGLALALAAAQRPHALHS